MKHIDIVFDGPPSHESGRFVEVEDDTGASINFGEWVERDDGYWVLRITALGTLTAERDAALALLREIEWHKSEADEPNYCLFCERYEGEAHADECRLAAMTKKGE